LWRLTGVPAGHNTPGLGVGSSPVFGEEFAGRQASKKTRIQHRGAECAEIAEKQRIFGASRGYLLGQREAHKPFSEIPEILEISVSLC
jgi:hypothetical protein